MKNNIKVLQTEELKVMKIIKEICEKENIRYFMIGGSYENDAANASWLVDIVEGLAESLAAERPEKSATGRPRKPLA